jgi:hypothetical protein
MSTSRQLAIWPLIKVTAIITLAVTILRLVGELEHWSRTFVGQPGGDNPLIGITWLAPLFGIYFAMRLVRAGYLPSSTGRALGTSTTASTRSCRSWRMMPGTARSSAPGRTVEDPLFSLPLCWSQFAANLLQESQGIPIRPLTELQSL